MTRPRWIVDLHEDFPGSAVVAQHLGEDALVVAARDAMMGRWPAHEGAASGGRPLVAYGTMRTMTRLRREPHLGTAVFDDYAVLRCSSYYRYVHDLLRRTAFLVPFSAVPGLPLARMLAAERVFLRSDTNYKLFPAGVHAVADLARWLDTQQEHASELVVLSEVVDFAREYRCFCRDGRVFCGSSYPDEPYLPVPEDVRVFAEEAATRLLAQGTNMVTVDVGVAADGSLRLVEMGGVNSWGIYGASVPDFVTAMEAEAIARSTA